MHKFWLLALALSFAWCSISFAMESTVDLDELNLFRSNSLSSISGEEDAESSDDSGAPTLSNSNDSREDQDPFETLDMGSTLESSDELSDDEDDGNVDLSANGTKRKWIVSESAGSPEPKKRKLGMLLCGKANTAKSDIETYLKSGELRRYEIRLRIQGSDVETKGPDLRKLELVRERLLKNIDYALIRNKNWPEKIFLLRAAAVEREVDSGVVRFILHLFWLSESSPHCY